MLVMSFLLELLRTKQRVDQVNEQPERRDSGNDVIHGFLLLQLVAGLGEGPAAKQKSTTDSDIEQIEHLAYSVSVKITSWPARRSRRASRFSVVGHHRFWPPITTIEPGLKHRSKCATRSRHRYI